ncbi:LuxR C-terminal-related transcriptional regulator [Kitasatospora sp. NPDC057738]|uniref:LuxR C-terminal-related transcriptional regulator n=1 Tax=Kitasatospora sp. NPDC057738 TaxID=3346233 RepID=UPI00368D58D4
MTRPLTQREADVLRYAAQGYKDHEIARALGRDTTERDIHNARLRAVRATGARTLDQAIQIHNQPTGDQP